MENVIEIIKITLTIIAAVMGTLIPCVVKIYKAKGETKKAAGWAELSEIIQTKIEEAENFLNYSGEEKKEFVLTRVKNYADLAGISFEREKVAKKVNEIVAMTKKVNIKNEEETQK